MEQPQSRLFSIHHPLQAGDLWPVSRGVASEQGMATDKVPGRVDREWLGCQGVGYSAGELPQSSPDKVTR